MKFNHKSGLDILPQPKEGIFDLTPPYPPYNPCLRALLVSFIRNTIDILEALPFFLDLREVQGTVSIVYFFALFISYAGYIVSKQSQRKGKKSMFLEYAECVESNSHITSLRLSLPYQH